MLAPAGERARDRRRVLIVRARVCTRDGIGERGGTHLLLRRSIHASRPRVEEIRLMAHVGARALRWGLGGAGARGEAGREQRGGPSSPHGCIRV